MTDIDQTTLRMIEDAVVRARRLHPWSNKSREYAFVALAEEFGEVAREMSKRAPGWRARLMGELIDLAAVTVRMLQEEWMWEEEDESEN